MIGSPWNPFFGQPIPGTRTRYDGRLVDSADDEQHGAFDLQRLPLHLAVYADNNGQPAPDDPPRILTRDIGLVGNTDAGSVFQLLGGYPPNGYYGTATGTLIIRTAFLYWYKPGGRLANKLPRVIYYENVGQNRPDWWEPLEAAPRRYWLAAGISHAGINYPEETVNPPPGDWRRSWSLWLTDDVPADLGGTPDHWADVPGTAIIDPGEDPKTYPLWTMAVNWSPDTPAGSRLASSIDLNRRTKWLNTTTSTTRRTVMVEPWYRSAVVP